MHTNVLRLQNSGLSLSCPSRRRTYPLKPASPYVSVTFHSNHTHTHIHTHTHTHARTHTRLHTHTHIHTHTHTHARTHTRMHTHTHTHTHLSFKSHHRLSADLNERCVCWF